jgi:hypothetical protein
MEKQISEYTVTELKALAYDEMSRMDVCQSNIRFLNQELQRRLNPAAFDAQKQADQVIASVASELEATKQ